MKTQISLLILVILFSAQYTSAAPPDPEKNAGRKSEAQDDKTSIPKDLEGILTKLNKQNKQLKTYQADIEYLYIQDPELIDSRTTRTGKIYYTRTGKRSKLKIRFEKRKEDESKPVNRVEVYYFDGVWLKVIDHQNKTVNSYQKAPSNKPVDAFELISRDFPIVGFTNIDDLRKNFMITLVENEGVPEDSILLKLDVKKDSDFARDYSEIDFYIDKKTFLPARMRTESVEGDIYDFKFTDPKINKKLKESVFDIEKPANFSENTYPLKKNNKSK